MENFISCTVLVLPLVLYNASNFLILLCGMVLKLDGTLNLKWYLTDIRPILPSHTFQKPTEN